MLVRLLLRNLQREFWAILMRCHKMDYSIEKVSVENYTKFDDMIYWRMNGEQRIPSCEAVTPSIKNELSNPNLYLYAVQVESIYVGWISLIYMPKVGRFNGYGHIYVDELWIEPSYRNNGFAKALMKEADRLAVQLKASGIRLYVNTENLTALKLYEKCGYSKKCEAIFMEK